MGVPYAEVIGDPIAHSKSPIIHQFWLRQMKIIGEYKAVRIRPAQLGDYLGDRRRDPNWRGCNVTMPLKEPVSAHVDDIDPVARRIGAVNTVINHSTGLLIGTNTDFQGAHFALSGVPSTGRKVVLLGAGGAARAVLEELRQAGPLRGQ